MAAAALNLRCMPTDDTTLESSGGGSPAEPRGFSHAPLRSDRSYLSLHLCTAGSSSATQAHPYTMRLHNAT